jgi:hypothetical protein
MLSLNNNCGDSVERFEGPDIVLANSVLRYCHRIGTSLLPCLAVGMVQNDIRTLWRSCIAYIIVGWMDGENNLQVHPQQLRAMYRAVI